MNASELATTLATTMLAWEQAQRNADDLKAEIEAAVLKLEMLQTVGSIKATYSGGRKSYDYATAAAESDLVGADEIAMYTTQPAPRVNWQQICKHVGISDVPFTKSAPSVAVKLTA